MGEPSSATEKSSARFSRALRVVVDKSMKETVQDEPQFFADALLPALAPALKRLVTGLFSELVATVQQVLERSLSRQSILWRVEALRTGRSFAEIAVLHSLIYRVDHVMLIDHESGLLLGNVSAKEAPAVDPDMIGGMVAALTDFVRDTFLLEHSPPSGTLKYGDYLVWTERGKTTTIAMFIRGHPPEEVRNRLQQSLFQIQSRLRPILADKSNRSDVAARVEEYLTPCLSASYKPKKRASKHWRWVALALLLLPLVTIAFFTIRPVVEFRRYETTIKKVPGIVILEAQRVGGKFKFSGLRDRFSDDPAAVFQKSGLDPGKAVLDLKPFVSEESSVLSRRVLSMLEAPAGVAIEWHGRNASLTGVAPLQWIKFTARRLELLKGWLSVDLNHIQDTEGIMAQRLVTEIENTRIQYSSGSVYVGHAQEAALAQIMSDLRKIGRIAGKTGRSWNVAIEGFADSSGNREANRSLSRMRAEFLAERLRTAGITPNRFDIIGHGENPMEGRVARVIVHLQEKRGRIMRQPQ